MTTKIDEVIEKAKEVNNFMDIARNCGYSGNDPEKLIKYCEKIKAMNLNFGDKLIIPYDFTLSDRYYLTNSKTHYKPKNGEWFIVWDNGNIGRLQFISEKYYSYVAEEWNAFLAKMLSYNPVDYDPCNCEIVYDIENGKKIMNDYKNICEETKIAMNKKINYIKIQRMEEELEQLR